MVLSSRVSRCRTKPHWHLPRQTRGQIGEVSFDVVVVLITLFHIEDGSVSVDHVYDIDTIGVETMSSEAIARHVEVERVVHPHEQGMILAEVIYALPHAGAGVELVEENTAREEVELSFITLRHRRSI